MIENPENNGLKEISAEAAARHRESMVQDTFDDIWGKIQPLIAEGKYAETNDAIEEQLDLLASMMGGDHMHRLAALRTEFNGYLPPEVRSLINPEGPDAKAKKAAASAKQLGAQVKRAQIEEDEDIDDEGDEEPDKKELPGPRERTWDVPPVDEIKPGMIFEIADDLSGGTIEERFEIMSPPYTEFLNGYDQYFATIRDLLDGSEYERSLSECGVAPFNGEKGEVWSGWNHPARWYMKEKEKAGE